MRIVCPSCAATYEVPESSVKAGRRTRCARCGETWSLSTGAPDATASAEPPPDAAPAEAADPRDETPAPARLRQPLDPIEPKLHARLVSPPAQPPRGQPGVWVGWLASLVVLAALGWAATSYRGVVMQAWPPSTRVYAAIGLVH